MILRMEAKNNIEKCLVYFKELVEDQETKSIPYAAIKAIGSCLKDSEQETATGLTTELAETKRRMLEMARKENFLDKTTLPLLAAINICEHMLYKDMMSYQTESMHTMKTMYASAVLTRA